MRRKKIWSILLVGALTFGTVMQVGASNINDATQKGSELEAQKKAAETEKGNLASELNQILSDMTKTQAEIETKLEEIEKKELELMQAKINENNQYESMKKRIKYMYENGNVQFIEILVESKTIGEFLNNAEYISQISEYDRNMLVEFQKVVKAVEDQEAALQAENEQLQQLQNTLTEKQTTVETLLATKSAEIGNLDAQIGENAKKISELQAAAAAAEAAKQQQAAASGSGSGSGFRPGGGGGSVSSGSGRLAHPCPGSVITSYFGYRDSPTAGATSDHGAVDFGAGMGAPIYASESGTVTTATYSSARGYYVVINHGNGLSTLYQHCSQLYVSVGQSVSRGMNIASVGSTGVSTGPHLHYEVWENGTPVDPLGYL